MLDSTDWNDAWKNAKKFRMLNKDSKHWDQVAPGFSSQDHLSDYARQFIEYADIAEGDSVLDMGCGTGALAFPIAQSGHQVFAADFSEGMLGYVREGIEKKQEHRITPILMSWEDDWNAHGIGAKSVDVCIASRSLACDDMQAAFEKLSNTARKKVCITLAFGATPRCDRRLLEEIGLKVAVGRDFWYAINILLQMGYAPKINYIDSPRVDTYDSFNEAFENLSKMVQDAAFFVEDDTEFSIDQAMENLRSWLDENLIENPQCGVLDTDVANPAAAKAQKAYKLKRDRIVRWAFLSWEV